MNEILDKLNEINLRLVTITKKLAVLQQAIDSFEEE